MAQITQISVQAKNKERCNVYLDNVFYCALEAETVVSFQLKNGMEISTAELEKIQLDSEKNRAFDKALTYISKSMKTKKQVKTYLAGKGYTDAVVFYVTEKLKGYSFLDDLEYAKQYINFSKNKKGRKLLEYELIGKGVSDSNIEKAMSQTLGDQSSQAEEILRKYLKNKPLDLPNIAKGYKYLMGKGFLYEEVDSAVRALKKESEWNES